MKFYSKVLICIKHWILNLHSINILFKFFSFIFPLSQNIFSERKKNLYLCMSLGILKFASISSTAFCYVYAWRRSKPKYVFNAYSFKSGCIILFFYLFVVVVYPLPINILADNSYQIYRSLKWRNNKMTRILSISDEIKSTLRLDIA